MKYGQQAPKGKKGNNPSTSGNVKTKKKNNTTHLDNSHCEAENFKKGVPQNLNPGKSNTGK